jgi:hypothetical protein
MVDCKQYYDGKCKVGNIDVDQSMCEACLAASIGPPHAGNLNRHLGSVALAGYEGGFHKDRDLAERGVIAICKGMCQDAGITMVELQRKTALPPVDPPGENHLRCKNLSKKAVVVAGCGCWRKSTYICEIDNGRHVVPILDCPCDDYVPIEE